MSISSDFLSRSREFDRQLYPKIFFREINSSIIILLIYCSTVMVIDNVQSTDLGY